MSRLQYFQATDQFRASQAGFTLIEMLIVTTLSVMLLLAASSLFMIFIVSNTKTSATQQVKQEGEQALSQMEFLIRNAVELIPNTQGDICENGMSSIRFVSYDGGVTRLFAQEDESDGATKIASNSGVYLHSGAVELTEGPTFSCVTSEDGVTPHVTIRFTMRKGSPGVQTAIEIVEETFETGVIMRSI